MRRHAVRRPSVALAGVVALAVAGLVPTAQASPPTQLRAAPLDVRATSLELGFQLVPKGSADSARGAAAPANPFLGLLPDPASADLFTWRQRMAEASAARAPGPAPALVVTEQEPVGVRGRNDTTATAELVRGFGTGRRESGEALLRGNLAPLPGTTTQAPSAEDDGSIPLAVDLTLVRGAFVRTTGVVGDGPHGSGGSGTGDFDFYAFSGVAGEVVSFDIDTPASDLDSVIVLWTSTGQVLAGNDDSDGFDSLLEVTLPAAGEYFLSVAGYPSAFPADPFDPASGFGAGSEGAYTLTSSVDLVRDVDAFAVDLEPGDVLGVAASTPAVRADVVDPAGVLVMGSRQDLSSFYPASSPLPGGADAVAAHVADRRGRHVVLLSGGQGAYEARIEVHRAGGQTSGDVQIVYVDVDGAQVDTSVFGGPGPSTLSPLSSFLPAWGLRPADEPALVRQIMRTVRESVAADTRSAVRRSAVVLLDSRVVPESVLRRPEVSHVVVGGTIDESGIPTIGIAESIDVGNFETGDQALVLLDILSGSTDEWGDASLNFYMGPGTSRDARIRFVGQAVGNVVAHEIGHTVGSYHVDQFDEVANLMDQGGNFPVLYGVGPDGRGGTADDLDVDFGEDVFNPNEGFLGIEDTLTTTAWGLNLP